MKKPVTQEILILIFVYALTITVAKFWDALTLDSLIVSYWTLFVVYLFRFLRQKKSSV